MTGSGHRKERTSQIINSGSPEFIQMPLKYWIVSSFYFSQWHWMFKFKMLLSYNCRLGFNPTTYLSFWGWKQKNLFRNHFSKILLKVQN